MTYCKRIRTTDIAFHQQEQDGWCGAAGAQMLLHSRALGKPLRSVSQEGLSEEIRNKSYKWEPDIEWWAAPDGVKNTLDDRLSTRNRFQWFGSRSESTATRLIFWHIKEHEVAAFALVYGFQHWVLVRGFTTTAEPRTETDTSYTPVSLDIYDPWPPVPDALKSMTHADSTDGCGDGGTRGTLLNNISYEEWRLTGGPYGTGYMTGVPATIQSTWRGQFVSVCDPPDGDHDSAEGVPEPPSEPSASEDNDPTTALIDPRQKAQQGVQEYGLIDDDEWKPLFDVGLQPGRAFRVERLDFPGSFYFIVLFEGIFRGEETAPVAVRIDSQTGRYLQAVGVGLLTPGAQAVIIIDGDTALSKVENGTFDFKSNSTSKNVIVTRKDIVDPNDLPLVWKPCEESFSPFCPFYMVRLKGEEGFVLYVRALDGAVFTRLSSGKRGGL